MFSANVVLHNNGPAAPVSVTLNSSATVQLTETDDGDPVCTVSVTAATPISPAASTDVTVSVPVTLDCEIGRMGNDTDGDQKIDEDPVNGVNDDGPFDTQIDEDSGYLLPIVCVSATAQVTQPAVSDPTPGNNSQSGACETFLLKRNFTPNFTVEQSNNSGPSDPYQPADWHEL